MLMGDGFHDEALLRFCPAFDLQRLFLHLAILLNMVHLLSSSLNLFLSLEIQSKIIYPLFPHFLV